MKPGQVCYNALELERTIFTLTHLHRYSTSNVLTGREHKLVTTTVRLWAFVKKKHYHMRPFSLASDDIKNVDLTQIHNLSGPIAVEGAEPGDCLVVDILDGMPTFSCSLCPILFAHSQAI